MVLIRWCYENARSILHPNNSDLKISDILGRYRFFTLLSNAIDELIIEIGAQRILAGYSEGFYLINSDLFTRFDLIINELSGFLNDKLGVKIVSAYISIDQTTLYEGFKSIVRSSASKSDFRLNYDYKSTHDFDFSCFLFHTPTSFLIDLRRDLRSKISNRLFTGIPVARAAALMFSELTKMNFIWFRADLSNLTHFNTEKLKEGLGTFRSHTLAVDELFARIKMSIEGMFLSSNRQSIILHIRADDIVLIVEQNDLSPLMNYLNGITDPSFLKFDIGVSQLQPNDTPTTVARRALLCLQQNKEART